MKKVLIASNKKIDRKLKKEIEMVSDIIQYKEGIIELLELNSDINYIIFEDKLIGQIKNDELIEKIYKINKNIIIYIITENKKQFIKNNTKIIEKPNIKIINNIFDVELNEIFEENKSELIEKEKNKLNCVKKHKKLLGNKIINSKKIKSGKKIGEKNIISISGTSGVGKSLTTLKIAKYLANKNKKILIIDLDYINKSIKLILGKNENKDEIIKINKKINLIEYKLNMNIIEIITKYENEYDYILLDISSEVLYEKSKELLKICQKNIFLVEPNLLGIKKANTLLKIYTEEWGIEKNNINIIFNKYNKYSIKYEIIKNIFSRFKIIGKIKLNEKYDLIINKNNLNYLIEKRNKYKRFIRRISKKIIKIHGGEIIWN